MAFAEHAIRDAPERPVVGARPRGFPRWVCPASVVLLLLGYAPVLKTMVRQWHLDDDMSHGFFVPLIVGFILWQQREALLDIPMETNRWGLAILIWSGAQLCLGTRYGAAFAQQTAFLISLLGVILYLGGKRLLGVLAFPLLLLCFMVPIPAATYQHLARPLELAAAQLSGWALRLLGYPVYIEGTFVNLADRRLSVLEACSGMRSLMSLSFFGLAYAYQMRFTASARLFIFVMSVPVALLTNGARIVALGMHGELHGLGLHGSAKAAGAFWHDLYHSGNHAALGAVFFLVAIGALVLLEKMFAAVAVNITQNGQ